MTRRMKLMCRRALAEPPRRHRADMVRWRVGVIMETMDALVEAFERARLSAEKHGNSHAYTTTTAASADLDEIARDGQTLAQQADAQDEVRGSQATAFSVDVRPWRRIL